jgi:hypothetical protein
VGRLRLLLGSEAEVDRPLSETPQMGYGSWREPQLSGSSGKSAIGAVVFPYDVGAW